MTWIISLHNNFAFGDYVHVHSVVFKSFVCEMFTDYKVYDWNSHIRATNKSILCVIRETRKTMLMVFRGTRKLNAMVFRARSKLMLSYLEQQGNQC